MTTELPDGLDEEIFLRQLRASIDEEVQAICIRWYAVLDLLYPNGTRELATVTSEGMQEWEFEGLILNAPHPWTTLPEEEPLEDE